MLPDGPTTTTVAPPVGLAARENATQASASLRAVSRLISCRCARFVASADIVTSASRAGGVCAAALAALSSAMTSAARTIACSLLPASGRRVRRRTGAAATSLPRQRRLGGKRVRVLGVHVRVDGGIAHAVAVAVDVAERLLEQRRRRIAL